MIEFNFLFSEIRETLVWIDCNQNWTDISVDDVVVEALVQVFCYLAITDFDQQNLYVCCKIMMKFVFEIVSYQVIDSSC